MAKTVTPRNQTKEGKACDLTANLQKWTSFLIRPELASLFLIILFLLEDPSFVRGERRRVCYWRDLCLHCNWCCCLQSLQGWRGLGAGEGSFNKGDV